jgi:hypothetical protein
MITSFAVLLAPLTVGTLADATSLRAGLGVVPVALAAAAVALTLVRRARSGEDPGLPDLGDSAATGRRWC